MSPSAPDRVLVEIVAALVLLLKSYWYLGWQLVNTNGQHLQ